ncbi:helix-turn-helix transcriptional regulator [Rhizobium sp. BK176]|uniref:helix-turn-helix domain-containing protein n=1 Tax=Rhizobium sp. BK176 TaxID=2587071 RepID=UPI002167E15E|nr:helix-turn-helix transcriptional regulator [Rhizobium sp. BK176]MCS4089312.1 transcriptional regulator with XRE-family HTH domain [Rhizobium sp. BK176]
MSDATAVQFKALRNRAGLTLEALATAMGYRGASSIQRFAQAKPNSPPYLDVEFVRRLESAIVGLGTPPITAEDVYALASPEWRAARAASLGDYSGIDSLQDERRVPDVRVTDAGTLVEGDTWMLPQRVSEAITASGAVPFVIAVHCGNETFFVDRSVALVSDPGTYAIVDTSRPHGFRLESYDATRISSERRQTVLMSGVLGKVLATFALT